MAQKPKQSLRWRREIRLLDTKLDTNCIGIYLMKPWGSNSKFVALGWTNSNEEGRRCLIQGWSKKTVNVGF